MVTARKEARKNILAAGIKRQHANNLRYKLIKMHKFIRTQKSRSLFSLYAVCSPNIIFCHSVAIFA